VRRGRQQRRSAGLSLVTGGVDTPGYLVLSYGLPVDFATDFPVCRAAVTYPADGYAAIFG
jgi:hypothetical protein